MAEDDVVLYDANALSLGLSSELANAYPTHVVLLMGEHDAGKTTLLAEIHHAYLRAPLAGYLFAGSKTLIGFEERCFLSRLESGARREDTERTKYAGIRLLHLALAPEARPDSHTHFLLADVSGERFNEIRASVEEARELAPLIRQAAFIVLLVDGDRLSTARTQMATESSACILLRCLLEAGGLSSGSSLDVVISKWDYVLDRGAEGRAAELEESVRRLAGVPAPRFHRVAARVKSDVAIAPGFGIAELVRGWMEPAPRPRQVQANAAVRPAKRWYQRYRFRQGVL